ncbi:MAG TPA: hypothetical protein VK939_14720 [Longimicrobiales bacterium]|nr:hypothetical protein [Longimicrobiales bacterium]
MIFRGKKRAAAARAEAAAAGQDEWRVRESRFHDDREGQPLDIAGRVAICPRGHPRAIPTRFDRPLAELRCPECARSYPFPQASAPPAAEG